MLHRNLCETCGGSLNKIDNEHYECDWCHNVYATEKIENYADKLSKFFDESKLELISNAKKNLYNAVTAQYISSAEILTWCKETKKYFPDDFSANFYEAFCTLSNKGVAKMIRNIDVDEHYELLETLINFVIKSLEKSYVAAIKDLIERAYKLYNSDIEKYIKYITMVEDEAEKLDKCMYDTKQPRKAFVAYSSKDSDKAIELVEVLESQGISCFISLRNLRHGVGSQENYASALKEAMDNCTSFVFVSSMNSRNIECDAYNIEIPYVRQKDFNNAPPRYRASNDYKNIPQEYKKPRVEYRIEESTTENYADYLVDEFFDGYERAYTLKDVTTRVIRQSIGFDASATESQKEVKYCVVCLSENDKNAQRCTECGGVKFAPDLNAVAQIRKQEKEEKLRLEEEKRRQEAEKRKKEEEQRRRQEEETRKKEAEQKRKQEEENRERDEENAKRKHEAEEARRKREAELALIAEEERKKRRKKFGIISVVAIILILTILFVWVVPLVRNNQSESNTEDDNVVPYIRTGTSIVFGSYPQTEVTDPTLISKLKNKAGRLPTMNNSRAWTSYGYYLVDYEYDIYDFMWYIDVETGSEKYRGVYFTEYRPSEISGRMPSSSNSFQDDNGYMESNVYWFKYEPISWTILNENTTDRTALILCDMIIDSQKFNYHYEKYSDNNYAESTIRKWLNETFYNTAFTEIQKQKILITTIDNGVTSTGLDSNKYVCENTQDKVFLLSYQEATNSSYGFSTAVSRQKKSTNYAQSQGVWTDKRADYAGNGVWWLRSPDNYYDRCARYCGEDEMNDVYGGISISDVRGTGVGVVPALWINL